MEAPARQAAEKQRRMAQIFLVLVCAVYVFLLCVLSFIPEILQVAIFGTSMTLAIPVAFLTGLFVFIVMLYYVLMYRDG